MDWIKATVHTTTQGIEPVSGRFYQIGVTGVEICDARDFNDYLENEKAEWEYVDADLVQQMQCETTVSAYLYQEQKAQAEQTMAELKAFDADGEFGTLEISYQIIHDDDWLNNWKKNYKPIHVGTHTVIKPSWEPYDAKDGEVVVEIDPGAAFGTGTHETTRMCISALEQYVTDETEMLDVGCGSGILSIAGIMLGAKRAVGVDIDKMATEVATQNGQLHGLDSSRYCIMQGDLAADVTGTYDIVVANIIADIVIRLCKDVRRFMKSDGVFICSGIIQEREQDVLDALDKNGFRIVKREIEGEWVALTCK